MNNPFSTIGSSILFAKNQLVVFGDPPNDDLVVEQKNVKFSTTALFKSGISQEVPKIELEKLMGQVQLLTYSDAVAQFPMNSDLFEKIKVATVKNSSTHIRMFTHNDKLRFSLFDCRMSDPKFRFAKENSFEIHYIDHQILRNGDFTFTLKSDSFGKLPKDDYIVRVGDNSICTLTPAKKNVQFLMRDQDLQEPLFTFQSNQVGCEIFFAPDPNF